MGHWQHHPDYSSAPGVPRDLEFEGAESDFAALVRDVSSDVNAYTVLFELERAGLIEKRDKVVSLKISVYAPERQITEGLEMLARDADDLIACVEENLLGEVEVPHLHLKTEFDNICVDALSEIREWLLDRGTRFQEEARSFLARHDKDLNPRLFSQKGGARVAVAAFTHATDPGGVPAAESRRKTAKKR
jgi:hypothetical protein